MGSHAAARAATRLRAERTDECTWSGRDLEMSQFWQKKQPMLQPAVPMLKHPRARQKMVQRFFLDGINLQRGGMP